METVKQEQFDPERMRDRWLTSQKLSRTKLLNWPT